MLGRLASPGAHGMRKSVFAAFAALCLPCAPAFAGTIGTYPATITTTTTFSEASRKATRAYAGLNWALGGSPTPALVLGVTNTKVKSNGDVTGARLAFHLNLRGGIAPGALKLSFLKGKESFQGELGAGYNFIQSAPLLALGVNAPFVAAGVDGYHKFGLVPYITLHSQGKFRKPQRARNSTSVASCDPGDSLIPPATCQDDVP
jgi:hypothetical protein